MVQMTKTSHVNHHGKLDMTFELRRGITRMPHVFQQPPLKASRELYSGKNPMATVYLMESSGGMVAGDRNDITVKLLPESRVRLIQQSALKVYPSHTGEICVQKIDIEVGKKARLEWMPEVTIPFSNAKISMSTTVRLQEDSLLLWGEIIAPGREMHGEVFDYDSFQSKFKIYLEDELIAFDSLHFTPKQTLFKSIGMLEDARYIGSIWFVSPKVSELDLRALQESINVSEGLRASLTKLEGNAIHCRFLSVEQWSMQEEMKRLFTSLSMIV